LGTILVAGWIAVQMWRRGRRYPAYLLVALLISYFPTSNALVLIQEFFAERLWYLPSFFALAFLAAIADHYLSNSRRATVVSSATALIALALMGRTWMRNREWNGNALLYAAAYRDGPNSIGVLQLYGDWLSRNDETAKGIGLLKKALEIDPGYIDAHRSLADAYLQSGDSESARRHLETIDRLAPGAVSYNNLGVAYARQGNLARAEQEFRNALADPKAAPFAHYNLGMICHRTNRPDEAISHLEESLRLDPGAAATILDLGRLYVALRRPADAVRVFAIGTDKHPSDPRFWTHRATLLATSQDDAVRNGKEAVIAARRACELSGYRDGAALAVLAAAHAEAGDYAEAARTGRQALQIALLEGNAALTAQIQGQLALYDSGKPFRDPRF